IARCRCVAWPRSETRCRGRRRRGRARARGRAFPASRDDRTNRRRARGARRPPARGLARGTRSPPATSASHSRTPRGRLWTIPLRTGFSLASRARLAEPRSEAKQNSAPFAARAGRLHLTKSSAKGRRMSGITLAPRRRPLWRPFIMPVLLVIAALGWSAFWFYSASQVDSASDAWRAREAKSGRVYDCAKRSVAGFPFRLEVRGDGVSVSLSSQTATGTQAPVTAKLGEILVVAQVYDPKLLIAEFTAPATISDRDQPPSMTVNWSKARSSVVGLPAVPQRISLVFDDPSIDRVNGSVQAPLARARHIELHGRLVEGP